MAKIPSEEHHRKIAEMKVYSVYPHYLDKVVKKGRTEEELLQVIEWLTGYTKSNLQKHLEQKSSFEQFFREAKLNPHAEEIKGVICGYRIEELDRPLTRQVRYLDKLVDELAKGKKMEKILRGS